MRAHGLFRRTLVLAAIAYAGTWGGAVAAEGDPVNLTIDFAKLFKLEKPADTIIIGNPSIADASVSDEQTLVLTGKTAGTTNLIALDKDGTEILNTTLQVSSDVRQLTTVFYGAHRQTFSCAPVCEQVISVGDDPTKFDAAKEQITTRQQFAAGQ
jgi:Flp pilus assembly secretin CpaC